MVRLARKFKNDSQSILARNAWAEPQMALDAGNELRARRWALTSLEHSVGKNSIAYCAARGTLRAMLGALTFRALPRLAARRKRTHAAATAGSTVIRGYSDDTQTIPRTMHTDTGWTRLTGAPWSLRQSPTCRL